jgi:hypothetical protein
MPVVNLAYADSLNTQESVTNAADSDVKSTINHKGYDYSDTFTPSTTVAVNTISSQPYALVSAALTVDLTALVGTNGVTISLSGKKIVAIRIVNTGTHVLTVAKGASNGYDGFDGASAYSEKIPVGGRLLKFLSTNGGTVDATHKTLDFAGTGTDGFTITVLTN